uniref:Uncharacterized protein n=1 Tax=Nelumbo nucifera TaxID=4432 RepID=A0A822ZF30_NELNU|nr:TPA_asm: hypothetical protein HUJ06_014531 [Nelumbo nucifera]
MQGKVNCKKEGDVECKEAEDKMFENEDYMYTNSIP